MRRSISRIASRYSVSLRRSPWPILRLQAIHAAFHEIEQAAALAAALPCATAGSVLSPSPKRRSNSTRGFTSIGLGVVGTAPGNRIGVRAAIAGVAAAREAGRFHADFERTRTACCLREFARGDLVGGNAGVNVRAFGLLRMHAGEPRRARARMVAAAVAERAAVDLRQITQHQQSVRGRAPGPSWWR